MALSQQTINKHNLKRAQVFAQHGLGTHDIHLAHPKFEGPNAGGNQDCVLCDHKHIVWQFSITFDVPDVATMLGKVSTGLKRTEEVTLKYVGSKCITDWLDAVPESTEGLEELRERWAAEIKKCEAAKKLVAAEKYCEEAGFVAHADTSARKVAYQCWLLLSYQDRAGLTWKQQKSFKRNAYKVRFGTCSPGTTKKWLEMLLTCGGLSKLSEIEIQSEDEIAAIHSQDEVSDSAPESVNEVEETTTTMITTTTIPLDLLISEKYRNLTGAEIHLLLSTLGTPAAPKAAPAPAPTPTFNPDKVMPSTGVTVQEAEAQTESDDGDEPTLLEKGKAIFDSGAYENLSAKAKEAFLDMHKRLVKYGSFKTPAQTAYYEKLVTWATQPKKGKAAPAAANNSNGAQPGDEAFSSASGIEGARY